MVTTCITVRQLPAGIYINGDYKGTIDERVPKYCYDASVDDLINITKFGYETFADRLTESDLGGLMNYVLDESPTTPISTYKIEVIGTIPEQDQTIFKLESVPDKAKVFVIDPPYETYIGETLINFIQQSKLISFRLEKEGYEHQIIPIDQTYPGKIVSIQVNLTEVLDEPIEPPGEIRCILTAEYSVPSGTHPFNLWVLYGIDSDGTYENFASTGYSQWASGGQVNVESLGQTIITNIDLNDITLPPGTYDALTIIIDGVDTSITYDWEIKNNVLIV